MANKQYRASIITEDCIELVGNWYDSEAKARKQFRSYKQPTTIQTRVARPNQRDYRYAIISPDGGVS